MSSEIVASLLESEKERERKRVKEREREREKERERERENEPGCILTEGTQSDSECKLCGSVRVRYTAGRAVKRVRETGTRIYFRGLRVEIRRLSANAVARFCQTSVHFVV